MNSLISILMSASSLPNMNSASAFASSVFPTPVGPRKMNDPIGRLGSFRPARARRTALEMISIASCWPMTRWWIDSSMWSSRSDSSWAIRVTGMPVHMATTWAISSSPTVGDVADRQVGGCPNRVGRDGHLMVLLVALANAQQDLDRLLERWFLDHDRLEAPLEGGVALDVLAVLVEGRGPDALQLAARQRRLEDVRGVDRTLGSASTNERMELVDEENRVVRVAQLLDDLFEPLLELAAVLRAGNERPDVERQDALVEQRLGDVAVNDPVGEALRDRRLADARLADQRRVVLEPAGQNLDDPLDLLLPADDRIELADARELGEVDAQLVYRRRLRRPLGLLGRPCGGTLREDADDLVADLVEVHAERLEDAGRDALAL